MLNFDLLCYEGEAGERFASTACSRSYRLSLAEKNNQGTRGSGAARE